MSDKSMDFYKDYYYPVILLDGGLNVAFKNRAAHAARVKPRVGLHIEKYLDGGNFAILRDIAYGKAGQQVIELKNRPSKCLARLSGDMTALIFFDSLNYIINNNDAETAARISEIAAKYGEREKLYADGSKKRQKIRGYFLRHIENMDPKKTDSEKIYCDIRAFLKNFEEGASPYINKIIKRMDYEIESKDRLFLHRLNESDFLTLNFILVSYALSNSVFGALNLKFRTNPGGAVLIYEFFPGSDFIETTDGMDLELAKLIAVNNNLKLEFINEEDEIRKKTQLLVHFINSGGFSQVAAGNNIISSEDISVRTEIELAFLRSDLK